MIDQRSNKPLTPWRRMTHDIIFEAETPAGRAFDIVLLISISLSVFVVILDSVASIRAAYGPLLDALEWFFTLVFTVEYAMRLISVRHPLRYARSFFGVVDLLAIIPTYLSLFILGSHYLIVVRLLRLLRIFRILKLAEYLREAKMLRRALRSSQRKISVFLLTIITLTVIIGAMMYVIEGEANGFTDIPTSIYWAIVTLSTVGYGDISPKTPLGQMVAAIVMLLGYGIIAVPTGIVTVELSRARTSVSTRACQSCGGADHDDDALYCKHCGEKL